MVLLAQHLNFYIHYFDRYSPIVKIYEEVEATAITLSERYPNGMFPEVIVSQAVNPYLLTLWSSTLTGDPFRCILHSYQVLEYAAFYYSDMANIERIRRWLADPAATSRLDSIAAKVADILTVTSQDDRIQSVIHDYVTPEAVWRVVEQHLDSFCERTEFEGGHSLDPLVARKTTVESFTSSKQWSQDLFKNMRALRNAVVHSREKHSEKSIAPTARNHVALRPWATLFSVVAEQIIAYRRN